MWFFLFLLWCVWDYVVGFVVTVAVRQILSYLEVKFDLRFQWIKITPGYASLCLEVGNFHWRNHPLFPRYRNFLEIKHLTVRVDPRPTVRYVLAMLQKKEASLIHKVFSLDVEGVTVNLERRDGQVSLWSALGLTETEAIEAFDSNSFTPEDFDDDGSDADEGDDDDADADAALEKRKEESSSTALQEEEEDVGASQEEGEPSGGHYHKGKMEKIEEAVATSKRRSKFLGQFQVARITVRQVRCRPEALLVSKDTTSKTVVVKVKTVEMDKRTLRPKYATKKQLEGAKRQGLYLDELIWRAVTVVAKDVWADKKVRKIASHVTADAVEVALKSTARSVTSSMLNVTRLGKPGGAIHGAKASAAAAEGKKTTMEGTLRVKVLAGRYFPSAGGPTYVKVAVGKKNVKAKSPIASKSRDPDYKAWTVDLAPLEAGQPLKVQVLEAKFFGADDKLLPTLKIPIAPETCDGIKKWFAFPDQDDDKDDDKDEATAQVKDPTKTHAPAIHLTLTLLPSS